MTTKRRLDLLLVERGFAETRNKAQALILAGQVKVFLRGKENQGDRSLKICPQISGQISSRIKPGTMVAEDSIIEVEAPLKYVSRGGEKLEAALEHWNMDVRDKVCLDIGASTGGFTDCLLQKGAKKVYAIDVGHGQLHPKIRNHPQVEVYEKCHILKWDFPWITGQGRGQTLKGLSPSFITIDVSFISLKNVLTKLAEMLQIQRPLGESGSTELLALIKPQFEVGPKFISKGIVKNPEVRKEAIQRLVDHAKSCGFVVVGHFPCPVLGMKGNQEEWLRVGVGG